MQLRPKALQVNRLQGFFRVHLKGGMPLLVL